MNFIAKVEDNQMSNIQEIAKSLEKMGIQIKKIMKITGTIAGTGPSTSLGKLKIKGIKSAHVPGDPVLKPTCKTSSSVYSPQRTKVPYAAPPILE